MKVFEVDMKIKFALILVMFLSLISCGRKGPLETPKDRPKPKFDKVIDEL
jgi:predicted small lipoprotein YifL